VAEREALQGPPQSNSIEWRLGRKTETRIDAVQYQVWIEALRLRQGQPALIWVDCIDGYWYVWVGRMRT